MDHESNQRRDKPIASQHSQKLGAEISAGAPGEKFFILEREPSKKGRKEPFGQVFSPAGFRLTATARIWISPLA